MSKSKPNIIAIVDAAWGTGETAESGEGIGSSGQSAAERQMTSGGGRDDAETRSGRGGALSKGRAKKPAGKKAVRRPPPRRP